MTSREPSSLNLAVPTVGSVRGAGALTSGLDVLEVLAQHPEGLGVTAVARAVGHDKGNMHRILRVLEERGYVEQDPGTKVFRASAQLLSLAGRILSGLDLSSVARPVMRALSESTGEAVHLVRRMRSGGVYVAQERQGGGIVTVETEIGAQPVIHATASGKALYCMADRADLSRVVHEPMSRHTMRTIVSIEALMSDLQRVQERGYALDDEELNLGVRCVAAPIFDLHGTPVASIGISGPASRVTLARVDELGLQVSSTAFQITKKTGGHVPAKFGAHLTTLREVHE